MLSSVWILFLAFCLRLHDFSIEHTLNLDPLCYWFFFSEACNKKFLVMIFQPIFFFDSNENRFYLSLINLLLYNYLLRVFFQKLKNVSDEIRANPLNNGF